MNSIRITTLSWRESIYFTISLKALGDFLLVVSLLAVNADVKLRKVCRKHT